MIGSDPHQVAHDGPLILSECRLEVKNPVPFSSGGAGYRPFDLPNGEDRDENIFAEMNQHFILPQTAATSGSPGNPFPAGPVPQAMDAGTRTIPTGFSRT